MTRLLVLLVLGGCLVDGKDVVGPGDPLYAAICEDSTVTDASRACLPVTTIVITIENPNPQDSTASD
jgi:hypothetical protein